MVFTLRINRIQVKFSSEYVSPSVCSFFRTSSYKKHDAEFCYQVAKEVLASGVRPKVRKHSISESTIRFFIKSLKERLAENLQVTIKSMFHKKRGRHTLLPSENDEKLLP